MEVILNNPGFQHIAENVFLNLTYEKLETCRLVNEFCKEILDNPMFWLNKFIQRGLSKKNQIDWKEAIQITPYFNLETNILNYLKQSSKNERVIDIPCHVNEETLNEYSEKIMELKDIDDFMKFELKMKNGLFMQQLKNEILSENDDATKFQIMVLIMDNYNALCDGNNCPVLLAVTFKSPQIIKILAPLTADNPNAPDKYGVTPIYQAACKGYTEIVKILTPLTDNPNAPDEVGRTPIYRAAMAGHTEIVKYLAPLTDNPNASDVDGDTPIHAAACHGHTEIVKILAPLTENPNAPNNRGKTPAARNAEIRRILKTYKKSKKCTANVEPPTTKSAKRARNNK